MTPFDPSWPARYVGVPHADHGRAFDGADCWGLAMLVYRAELGIELPGYDGLYLHSDEAAEVDAVIAGATSSPAWTIVEEAKPFDVVILRLGPLDRHVGLVVRQGTMLHMMGGDCAKLGSYREPRYARRVTGIYRHIRMMERAP